MANQKYRRWTSFLSMLILFCTGSAVAQRTSVSLDGPWCFRFDTGRQAAAGSAAPSAWKKVEVPHSWPKEGESLKDESFRTSATYRRSFFASSRWRSKRVILHFDAVSLVADVSLNGRQIGTHRGGFAAFGFDITDALRFGQNNVLVVRVSNEKSLGVPPLAGDFLVYGGIYRHVSLMVLDPVNITPLDHGSPGVFLSTSHLDTDAVSVTVRTELRNDSGRAKLVSLRAEVLDAAGRVVANSTSPRLLPPGETTWDFQTLDWAHPHLWDGVKDPYLYSVHLTLGRGTHQVDSLSQPLGLRRIHFDPQRGLVMNGRAMQIHGVCLHQEGATNGWAVTEKDERRDMQLIRNMGADGIRLAHYQHSQSFLDLADRNGMLIWAELAQVDRVSPSDAYRTDIRQQLVELIRQNYNHPSIFTWSLYNELNPPTKDAAISLVRELNELAHEEDPSRPTTGADDKDTLEQFHEMTAGLDLIAFNTYPGWYFGKPSDMGSEIDRWNAIYGSRGIAVSEYGAGASVHQHQSPPDQKAVQIRGLFHPEEWQAAVHEQTYPEIRKRPFVWGSFVWNMFDFGSYGRHEGDTMGVNDKGLVTRDRETRKDAYFYYQANWTDKPMVHLIDCRQMQRSAGEAEIRAYSNEASVRLFADGASMGTREPDENHIAVWERVPLQQGPFTLRATGALGATDQCTLSVIPAMH